MAMPCYGGDPVDDALELATTRRRDFRKASTLEQQLETLNYEVIHKIQVAFTSARRGTSFRGAESRQYQVLLDKVRVLLANALQVEPPKVAK
jgi:hypothetical protein